MTTKEELKNQISIAKAEYKRAQKEYREQAKLEKKQKREFKKAAQYGTSFDRLRLRICAYFRDMEADLRYKIEDPDNYEADQVLEDINTSLDHFEKKSKKGKELSARELEVIASLYTATATVVDKELGSDPVYANDLKDRLTNLMPDPNALRQAEELMIQMAKMMPGQY